MRRGFRIVIGKGGVILEERRLDRAKYLGVWDMLGGGFWGL